MRVRVGTGEPTVSQVRTAVISRDDGCVARRIDPKAGPCRDWQGRVVDRVPLDQLEADYVRLGARAPRHRDPWDHQALCPGHHRGVGAQRGYVWATAHRAEARDRLEDLRKESPWM